MVNFFGKICLVFTIVMITAVLSSPMMYKKNDHDNYEPDLIPVSSTVIPLSVYEVSSKDGKTNESYKNMYMKHIHKKVSDTLSNPDTSLITAKKKYNEKQEKHANKSV